ncbi:MAG: hypothetical protein M3Y73_10300 [Actinomycetota bacterium]|nr:hypothetical protein [Actinomycetota bacterium]
MNETTNPVTDPAQSRPTDDTAALTPRRGPDLLTLVAGVGSLGIAATALLGGVTWLPDIDGRWVLAAMALLVGLLLVISSLRPARH